MTRDMITILFKLTTSFYFCGWCDVVFEQNFKITKWSDILIKFSMSWCILLRWREWSFEMFVCFIHIHFTTCLLIKNPIFPQLLKNLKKQFEFVNAVVRFYLKLSESFHQQTIIVNLGFRFESLNLNSNNCYWRLSMNLTQRRLPLHRYNLAVDTQEKLQGLQWFNLTFNKAAYAFTLELRPAQNWVDSLVSKQSLAFSPLSIFSSWVENCCPQQCIYFSSTQTCQRR